MKAFTINTDSQTTVYTECEHYKIRGSEALLGKVSFSSVQKYYIKDKPRQSCESVCALVDLDCQYNLVQIFYDQNKKIGQTVLTNPIVSPRITSNEQSILITKMIFNKSSNSLFFLACTAQTVFLQEADNPQSCRVLLDIKDLTDYSITNIFDCKKSTCTSKSYQIFIQLNENVLIELDLYKTEAMNMSSILGFLSKNKSEGKGKIVKYEYYFKNQISTPVSTYSVLLSTDESKNIRSVWNFGINDKIISLLFRPKKANMNNDTNDQKSMFCLSLNGGKVKIFHYESCSMRYEFKTTYGNVIALNYSQDGSLLGLGTENDNAYIIDAELNELIYCLEGHKNYVTGVIFEEQVVLEDEPSASSAIPNAHYESNSSCVEAYSSLNNKQQPFAKALCANPYVNKEISQYECLQILDDSDGQVDLRLLRKNRASITPIYSGIPISGDSRMRSCTTYDVYTGAMDGYLGVWRIEHFYDEGFVNLKNYFTPNFTKETVQIFQIEQTSEISLVSPDSIKIFSTDMVKIRNGPIAQIEMAANMIIVLSKINTLGSWLWLYFFHGVAQNEDAMDCDNNTNIIDISSKNNKVSSQSINKITESENEKDNNTNATSTVIATPQKERRGSSVSPSKKRQSPAATTSHENHHVSSASTSGADKRGKSSNKI